MFRPLRKKISSRTHKNDLISLKKPGFPHGNAYLYGVQHIAYLSFKVVMAEKPGNPRYGCESIGKATAFGLLTGCGAVMRKTGKVRGIDAKA
ncbi:hypothetical protein [Thalassospira xiamenensis]|uniref:hypothetical protein n=1 Tax=Thalassospira xiamenensis TaxID=220697 RepID=UPI003AA8C689